jgi:hypothetical protein
VAANAWDVYGRRPITEDEVVRETERLRTERLVAPDDGSQSSGNPVP